METIHAQAYREPSARPAPRRPCGRARSRLRGDHPLLVEYLVGALICSTPDAGPAGLPYTTYDTTGQATTPGSYAFLDAAGDVVDLRGPARSDDDRLRIHTSDADGASQAAVYGGIAVGDGSSGGVADCWVRYEVISEVKADPVAPPKEFAIKWHAYAFTGCTGTVAADAAVNVTWSPELNFLSTPTTTVRYGPFDLVPWGCWTAEGRHGHVASPGSGARGLGGPNVAVGDPTDRRTHSGTSRPCRRVVDNQSSAQTTVTFGVR